jgi:hypothetical protein
MTWIREDQAEISVIIEGTPYGGSWKECEGGNLEADTAKVRPGGMGMEQDAGGLPSRGDMTVRIPMSDVVALWVPTHEGLCGWADVTIGLSWLGPNKIPLGTKTSRFGTLKAVNLPNMGAGGDVGMYEIIVGMNEGAS